MAPHQRDRWRARDEGLTQGGFPGAPHRPQTRRLAQDLRARTYTPNRTPTAPPNAIFIANDDYGPEGWTGAVAIPGPGLVFVGVDVTSPGGVLPAPYVLELTADLFDQPMCFPPRNLADPNNWVAGNLTLPGVPAVSEMSAVVINQADGSLFDGRTFHMYVRVAFQAFPR